MSVMRMYCEPEAGSLITTSARRVPGISPLTERPENVLDHLVVALGVLHQHLDGEDVVGVGEEPDRGLRGQGVLDLVAPGTDRQRLDDEGGQGVESPTQSR